MRYPAYLVVATAVVIILLLSGCEKAGTPQQEPLEQQQEAVTGAGTSEPEATAAAAQNLSDGLDEALAELDFLEGLEK